MSFNVLSGSGFDYMGPFLVGLTPFTAVFNNIAKDAGNLEGQAVIVSGSGGAPVPIYRGISGSQYVISVGTPPENANFITIIGYENE